MVKSRPTPFFCSLGQKVEMASRGHIRKSMEVGALGPPPASYPGLPGLNYFTLCQLAWDERLYILMSEIEAEVIPGSCWKCQH